MIAWHQNGQTVIALEKSKKILGKPVVSQVVSSIAY